jgi:uridylate kinase
MESIVISIGGSVILSDDVTLTFFNELKALLEKLCRKVKIYIVVGGGKTARSYIKLGRVLNLKENFLDEIGIDITRLNAKLLLKFLGISNTKIPISTKEAKEFKGSIVLMGGTTPGHSTDMVGAELALITNASKFIIATNVDGVFNKDPNKYDNAKLIKKISIDKLIGSFGTNWKTAGKNIVVDGPALKIIKEAKIKTYVLNGKRLDQLENAINNKEFLGTIIKI